MIQCYIFDFFEAICVFFKHYKKTHFTCRCLHANDLLKVSKLSILLLIFQYSNLIFCIDYVFYIFAEICKPQKMSKPLFFTLLALFGISTAISAQGLAQEIGIYAGPVTFQSDFGERHNFDTNIGNTGFGIGIMHFINFSANNNRENYFTEHFKVRSDLSYSRTSLKHFGQWVERKPNQLFAQQLKNMHATSNILGLGAQIEFSPFMKIHDFENTIGSFSPYGSLGFQVSYYSTKVSSDLGDMNSTAVTPKKYLTPSDGRAHGFSSENGVVLSATAAAGVHYKLTTMSDLMFETRFSMYSSDWIDGLNPNKDIYKENRSNDIQVWFTLGYIQYLEF